jgi:hypothetical protein
MMKGNEKLTVLPLEPGSGSEFLAASHLFSVQIQDVTDAPWLPQPDGLERRNLVMQVLLDQVFKGSLEVQPGETFTLQVVQERENALVESDYHGMWSHIFPDAGTGYLVASLGESQVPAELMQEAACLRLLDGVYTADAHLAIEGERRYQQALQNQAASQAAENALEALLDFAYENRSQASDAFERYLWARSEPLFLLEPLHILAALLELLGAVDASLSLRRNLAPDLVQAILLLEQDEQAVSLTAIQAFLEILLQPESKDLFEALVQPLYSLVIGMDGIPRFPPSLVVPDVEKRRQIWAVLEEVDLERAHELAVWIVN